MADNEKNLPPRIYHLLDPDGIFDLWKDLVGVVVDQERVFAADFQKIVDPDLAPASFIDLMLKHLGNPFNQISLTLTQKRKLAKFLVPIYRQKGTAAGIINTVRFLTGIELTIEDPHGSPPGVGWEIGIGQVGFDTYVGGEATLCNLLNWSENFDNAVWSKDAAAVIADDTPGPSPFGGLADRLVFDEFSFADILQYVTPIRVQGEIFTGSVWLKATTPTYITCVLGSGDSFGIEFFLVDTTWQRYVFQHTPMVGSNSIFEFHISSFYGIPPSESVWAYGAQLIRGNHIEPYIKTTNDGADCSHPGRWIYHFIIRSPVALTDELESIIRMVADFIKPAHTHYTILDSSDPGAVDHWEAGLSGVGVETFVHA